MRFSYSPGPPAIFGAGRVAETAKQLGRLTGGPAPVLLMADPGVVAAGLAERVREPLGAAGFTVELFDGFTSDPKAAAIDQAAARARQVQAKAVIGLGGGSAMDAAKLTAAAAMADLPAADYQLGRNPLPKAALIKIAIPTTAGTGAEATRTSVFSLDDGTKVWAWGDPLRTDFAVLDPELTAGLPQGLTAATGIDALVHAIEAATLKRTNPVIEAPALRAIALVRRHLKRAVAAPDDMAARAGMQLAAYLAGTAIDGLGTGVAHAIGHAMGTLSGIHHGRAVGLALNAALAWNMAPAPDRFALVAAAFGLGSDIAALPDAYGSFLAEVGLDTSLKAEGLGPADADRLAQVIAAPENKAMIDANGRAVAAGDARILAEAVLAGTPAPAA